MGIEELILLMGGPQGAGLETSAQILASTFARLGYGVILDREYFSNIKGRHSYIHSHISSVRLATSLTYPVQLLASLDPETIFTHFKDLEDGGYLIYDSSTTDRKLEAIPSMEKDLKNRLGEEFRELGLDGTIESILRYLSRERRIKLIELNYPKIISKATEKFKLTSSQASRYVSIIIVGAIAGLLSLPENAVSYGIERRFGEKLEFIKHNKFLVNYVSSIVREKYGSPLELEPSKLNYEELMIVSGNDIIAMGKIVGGLRFQSYYPITPAADESFFLETYERLRVDDRDLGSLVVIQTEDEIAAITSAIGAALTGARSATATSGPGFSLMVEGLGWAGMNETPVVITYYQRGGPSTGLPTRGSQSDLLFVLYASHGEFPRIVLASGDHIEAFQDAVEAFNFAEKYQVPVIHLLDKFLANSITTSPIPDFSSIKIDRGKIAEDSEDYRRFDLSNLISPKALMGLGPIAWYTGDEHDERGHINEDPVNRGKMYRKRMEKLELADREIPQEKRAIYYGPEEAEFLLLGWGFVKGAALEALRKLERKGFKGAYLHFRMFSPFPSKLTKTILKRFDPEKVIAVEHNYLAQAAQTILIHTGIKINKSILKYTGRPIYINELVNGVKSILKGEDKVVLMHGA